METSYLSQELEKKLRQHNSSIRYSPMKHEIRYDISSFFTQTSDDIILPNNKTIDPFVWADHCKSILISKKPYLLIPGKQFDIYGNRIGRGAGWYDRFLSKIPRKWLRIGVTDISSFSRTPIKQNLWDEKVDWIVVNKKGQVWQTYKAQKS